MDGPEVLDGDAIRSQVFRLHVPLDILRNLRRNLQHASRLLPLACLRFEQSKQMPVADLLPITLDSPPRVFYCERKVAFRAWTCDCEGGMEVRSGSRVCLE